MFGLFRRKKAQKPQDPLAAYDQLLERLDRQGAEVRKSAATLLALRGELSRAIERDRRRIEDAQRRQAEAASRSDTRGEKTLGRDVIELGKQLAASEEALARTRTDAELLLELADELGRRASELRAERTSARARFAAGQLVSTALQERTAEFNEALIVDAARDEVERAHALAEIYREEKDRGS